MPLHVAGVGALQKCPVMRVAGVLLIIDPDVVKLVRVSLVVSVIGNDVAVIGMGTLPLIGSGGLVESPLAKSSALFFKCKFAFAFVRFVCYLVQVFLGMESLSFVVRAVALFCRGSSWSREP